MMSELCMTHEPIEGIQPDGIMFQLHIGLHTSAAGCMLGISSHPPLCSVLQLGLATSGAQNQETLLPKTHCAGINVSNRMGMVHRIHACMALSVASLHLLTHRSLHPDLTVTVIHSIRS